MYAKGGLGMRSAFLCLLVFAALLHPAAAAAQIIGRTPPYQCQQQSFYGAQNSADAPASVAAVLAQSKDLEFRTCRDTQSNIHYFLRERRPNRQGVCRIFEHEIFPGAPSDRAWFATQYDQHSPQSLSGWREDPPPQWQADKYVAEKGELALVTAETCPPATDARYAAVNNVTDGILKAFDRAWRAASASPGDFDFAFATAALKDGATPATKNSLRDDALSGKVHFGVISCGDDGCVASTRDVNVSFDMGGNGVVFTALSPVYEI